MRKLTSTEKNIAVLLHKLDNVELPKMSDAQKRAMCHDPELAKMQVEVWLGRKLKAEV